MVTEKCKYYGVKTWVIPMGQYQVYKQQFQILNRYEMWKSGLKYRVKQVLLMVRVRINTWK